MDQLNLEKAADLGDVYYSFEDVEKVSKKQTVALMHEQLHREEIKIKMI
jgi:hypothetical protein